MKKFLIYSLLLLSFNLSFAGNTNPNNDKNKSEEVKVSWYGDRFHGRLTASGTPFDMNQMTAAHKSLPFGTKVEVTNITNGKSVIVTINDRGPYVGKRIFDLSKAAFHQIAKKGKGIATVTYRILN
ncbi:septal ring lytic transglycosylase RlpA family protein [Flavobacteriaceae bacterium Ap0902]|nr:septal ring lytic transglycosylase RlpA family protein [Flavobacteriaceae bacterium Ap0902]